ncbi:MAG: MBL fold metallo-hydrolase [Desulfarculaceae bacterium]|nr:MBL fold metallo-hydrolase [Desulfarculaceae bacterium]MCF8074117.1 MBL fold metallo-hydrolase [Desulfarculaceae bacterium]MCF8103291.1 MBL fold metallo-hydrolase [Desulfarculaceae bacterium]MCF8116851.1 MBL fold metallo-hydrolase [Desulfarculaceae bacterium]
MNPSHVIAALLGVLLTVGGCFSPKPFDEAAWQKTVAATDPAKLYAPHRDSEGRFYNPWLKQDKSTWDLFRWWLSSSSLPGLQDEDFSQPAVANDGAYLKNPAAPASLTWVGHATYVVQWEGQVVVTDPFFSNRAAVVERKIPPPFGSQALPAGVVVLISHNHYDHLDSDAVAALSQKGALFLCPLGLGDLLKEMGAGQVRELDWWQSLEHGGTRFTFLPTQHWSRRFGQGYNESLWGAWLMQRDGEKIFYGGDSGYFKGFKEFGRRWPGIDVALIGIGASEPRWFMHYAHLDVPELFQAMADLGAKRLVPTQYGVLKLGDGPAAWPSQAIEDYVKAHPRWKGRVVLMPVGGRLMLQPGP